MGAQGIRRRKPRHDLEDPEPITSGDVDRLFGRFTWGAYTPAGNMERFGFFSRQFSRNGTKGAWAFVAQAKWVFIAIAVAIVGGVGAVKVVTFLLH